MSSTLQRGQDDFLVCADSVAEGGDLEGLGVTSCAAAFSSGFFSSTFSAPRTIVLGEDGGVSLGELSPADILRGAGGLVLGS